MALSSLSSFLFGFQVTSINRYISFATSGAEVPPSTRTATLNLGYYSLATLLDEVVRAFTAADPLHTYTATADRSIAGGTQNRVTIATTNTYLGIYFATGNPSNPATLLGFNVADYTGATTYTGSQTSGTLLVPNLFAYTYLPPTNKKKVSGVTNVSAAGVKETLIFAIYSYWQAQFKQIPASLIPQWEVFILWIVQQKAVDFTPDISQPNTFFSGTLEDPNAGLALDLTEMLPEFVNYYQTPLMTFRIFVE